MEYFTRNNTARRILEHPEVKKYLGIFLPPQLLSGLTEEYLDYELSQLEQVLQMPWGGPFIPEILLDAANRVMELTEGKRFRFWPLWHDAPEPFVPESTEDGGINDKKNVCLMRVKTNGNPAGREGKPHPAAVICPGGGYELLSVQNEGIDLAEYMEQQGYAAYVLLYRVSPHRYPEPQKDLALAIKFLRSHAEEFGIDPQKILLMGSSAAGHLCVSESAYHEEIDRSLMEDLGREQPKLQERYRGIPARADAVCGIYPVIDFLQYAHEPSFQAISGGKEELRDKLSMQKHVPEDFPPTFLWACRDDQLVPYQNTELMTEALKEKGIRTRAYLYPQGGHGCGLAKGTSAEGWTKELLLFLAENQE